MAHDFTTMSQNVLFCSFKMLTDLIYTHTDVHSYSKWQTSYRLQNAKNTSSTERELPQRLIASQRGESERHDKLSSIVSSTCQLLTMNNQVGW